MSALDELKGTFEKLVEPISQTLRTLEHEKSDNASLRDALADVRASQDTLRGEFQALGRKSAELESDNARLRRELTVLQDNARELEGSKADLTRAVSGRARDHRHARGSAGTRDCRQPRAGRGEQNSRRARQCWRQTDRRAGGRGRPGAGKGLAAGDREGLPATFAGADAGGNHPPVSPPGRERDRLDRRARARLEQLERSLAASEENRKKLSAACDEANERRQSECYAVNLKLDAMRSRAATAEKLLAEVGRRGRAHRGDQGDRAQGGGFRRRAQRQREEE